MKSRGMTQYRLINTYHFSGGQISRLKKNLNVSARTLDRLCGILDCGLNDVVEIIPDQEA